MWVIYADDAPSMAVEYDDSIRSKIIFAAIEAVRSDKDSYVVILDEPNIFMFRFATRATIWTYLNKEDQ